MGDREHLGLLPRGHLPACDPQAGRLDLGGPSGVAIEVVFLANEANSQMQPKLFRTDMSSREYDHGIRQPVGEVVQHAGL
jgi:hypothetical protein